MCQSTLRKAREQNYALDDSQTLWEQLKALLPLLMWVADDVSNHVVVIRCIVGALS